MGDGAAFLKLAGKLGPVSQSMAKDVADFRVSVGNLRDELTAEDFKALFQRDTMKQNLFEMNRIMMKTPNEHVDFIANQLNADKIQYLTQTFPEFLQASLTTALLEETRTSGLNTTTALFIMFKNKSFTNPLFKTMSIEELFQNAGVKPMTAAEQSQITIIGVEKGIVDEAVNLTARNNPHLPPIPQASLDTCKAASSTLANTVGLLPDASVLRQHPASLSSEMQEGTLSRLGPDNENAFILDDASVSGDAGRTINGGNPRPGFIKGNSLIFGGGKSAAVTKDLTAVAETQDQLDAILTVVKNNPDEPAFKKGGVVGETTFMQRVVQRGLVGKVTDWYNGLTKAQLAGIAFGGSVVLSGVALSVIGSEYPYLLHAKDPTAVATSTCLKACLPTNFPSLPAAYNAGTDVNVCTQANLTTTGYTSCNNYCTVACMAGFDANGLPIVATPTASSSFNVWILVVAFVLMVVLLVIVVLK